MRSTLFDIYDPYGDLEEEARLGLLPPDVDEFGMPVQRKRANVADLLPEEEKTGMLRSLANAGASGLTGLGWILDTPGSLIRGTVSGLMEGDPLKGVRSIVAPSDERVSGRDLLRQMGMAGSDDNWSNFAGGLAAEIVTDPLFYLNPAALLGHGAKSLGGKAMARAGLLDDVAIMARKQGMGPREFLRKNTARDLLAMPDMPKNAREMFSRGAKGRADELLDQQLAGAMNFKIPGTGIERLIDGGRIGDTVARGLDTFGEALKYNPVTGPVVNRITRMRDPSVLERLDPTDQWRAREAVSEFRTSSRNVKEEVSQNWLFARKADVSALPEGLRDFDGPRIQNAIRDAIEANLDPEMMGKLMDQEAVQAVMTVPEWRQYAYFLQEKLADTQSRRAALGLETPTAQSAFGTGFFPSQQVRFAQPRVPRMPDELTRRASRYDRGPRAYTVDDVVGKGRDAAYDLERRSETFRRLQAGEEGARLRDSLFGATREQRPGYIDEAFTRLGLEPPYSRLKAEGFTADQLRSMIADPAIAEADKVRYAELLTGLESQATNMKVQLAELLRTSDRQLAETGPGLFDRSGNQVAGKGMGMFDRHTAEEFLRYGVADSRSEANAKVILDSIQEMASDLPAMEMPGGGSVGLLDGLAELGFNKADVQKVLADRMKGKDVASMSIPKSAIEELKGTLPQTGKEIGPGGRLWNSFTNAFKIGALANPSYHTRNIYSGGLSNLATGEFNPIDLISSTYAGYQAGKGNYGPMINRLKNTRGFAHLSPDEIVEEVLLGASRNDLGQGLVREADGVASSFRNPFVGQDKMDPLRLFGEGGLLYDPNRTWKDWSTIRGVDFAGTLTDRPPPSETLNPFLQLHERVGRRGEDANRIGAYIESLRQGYSPDAAADLVYKTQVNYAPEAFTNFERQVKKYVPFYSWTRGITPSVVDNILQRPGGLQGQATRAISDLARPNEGEFTPEHLRTTPSILLPGTVGKDGNLRRALTNIDVPWEGPVNLLSPGTGESLLDRLSSSIQKTGMNLLGQTNPLIKAPLEMLMNRQLYSGREMSDLYSMLEQDIGPLGRPLEQLIANAPGGSRAISLARTARDSRMSPAERALKLLVNNFAGVRLTDFDPDRAADRAARDQLQENLKSVPGVRTYENLTVDDETLMGLSKPQQDAYLLYKVLQSEASKRSRARKKAQMDPLDLLLQR
jgi:hypothetical protein